MLKKQSRKWENDTLPSKEKNYIKMTKEVSSATMEGQKKVIQSFSGTEEKTF
jgi:hypothetical protein